MGEGEGGAKVDTEGGAGVIFVTHLLNIDGHATCKCTYTHKHIHTHTHMLNSTYTYAQDMKRLDCPFRTNQAPGSNPCNKLCEWEQTQVSTALPHPSHTHIITRVC